MIKVLSLILILLFLLVGCSNPIFENSQQKSTQTVNIFDENDAISKVIKEHPEFPSSVGSKEISLDDFGKQGHRLIGSLKTEVEKVGEDEYIVIMTKKWNIKVNDIDAVSYWKYKVTPDILNLIDSKEKADIVNIIK